MNDSISPLLEYHHKFCELAQTAIDKNDLRFHKEFSRFYWELHQAGFSVEEMCTVIRYVQAQNKKQRDPEYRRKIVPSKILGDMERFCEDLAEAKRLQALRVSPRQQAVNEFRKHSAPESLANTAQPIKDVLRKALL